MGARRCSSMQTGPAGTPSSDKTRILGLAVHRGDRAALGELFERITPALYAWIRLRLGRGPSSEQEVQDVLQEVWLRALSNLGEYEPGRSFRSWAFGIAKNVLLQDFERRARQPGGFSRAGMSSAGGDVSESLTSIGQRLAKEEAMHAFLAWVEALDPAERELLVYCGIERYTCAQAASRLAISAEAATKRWQALRARIRANRELETLAHEILD